MKTEVVALEPRLPFGRTAYATVTFGDADTDTPIPHDLPPGRYRDVHYLPVRLDRATILSTGSTPPSPGLLYLQSSVADATATLLLFLPREAR
jgi:hypothetical protein